MEKNFVRLSTIGGGALEEMFEDAMKVVADNINDPNTEAESVREINIKIKMKPTKSREAVVLNISCDPKVSGKKGASGFLFVSGNANDPGLYETDSKQLELIEIAKVGRQVNED